VSSTTQGGTQNGGGVSVDPRSPCVIGVAQYVSRPDDGPCPEPLALWQQVVRDAASDTEATGDVLGAVGSLQIVYCQSWPYDDPPGRLADALGLDPTHRLYSGIGGTTPQVLVNDLGTAILAGDVDVGVVCGAEALDTARRLKKAGEKPAWSHRDPEPPPFPFEAPFHPAEVAHEVFQAYLTFPLWDVARRAHLGVAPEAYRRGIGELMAPMTRVAAANPYAWFPVERSAEELMTPTAENRMVGYPYTKYTVSIMDVDLAGALIVASHAAADRLGVPLERRVYLRGWAYGCDPVYVAEHAEAWRSPAMAEVYATALRAAGLGVDDLAHFDLYSCFASSVHLALDALALEPSDHRGVTVTGGLPFAGGAGSDYQTHAIAAMVDTLRLDPGSAGLVTGVGMHLTKHGAGVYSTEPGPVAPPDLAALQAGLDAAHPPLAITDTASGRATVVTYSVIHGRDGAAETGLAVCDLPDGTRTYARVDDTALLAEMETTEWVGTAVDLQTDGRRNTVRT
jgi:acetyl-CoA C-acetyltransferase